MPTGKSEKKLLTTAEAAKKLKISVTSLKRIQKRYNIEVPRDENNYRIFTEELLQKFKDAIEIQENRKSQKAKKRSIKIKKEFPKESLQEYKEKRNKTTQTSSKNPSLKVFARNFALFFILGLLSLGVATFIKGLEKEVDEARAYYRDRGVVANNSEILQRALNSEIASLKTNIKETLNASGKERQNPEGGPSIAAVLGRRTQRPDYELILSLPTTINDTLIVEGELNTETLAILAGGISTENQNIDAGDGEINSGTLTSNEVNTTTLSFTSPGSINNLLTIDDITENTLEEFIDIDGDVEGIGLGNVSVVSLGGASVGSLNQGELVTINNGEITGGNLTDLDTTAITNLGAVTEGTWQATPIDTDYGGTGLTSYSVGDLMYADSENTLSQLGVGADRSVITSDGTVPYWENIATLINRTAALHEGNNIQENLILGTNTNYGIVLETDDTVRAFLDSAGNIGIGNTSPETKIHLGDSSNTPSYVNSESESMYIEGNLEVTGTIYGGAIIGPTSYDTGSVIFVGEDGYVDQNNTQFFWNDNTERLGIGTSSPNHKLDVRGSIGIDGNMTITGTVDGRDISSDGSDLDELYTTIGLSNLTTAEVTQLTNIDTNTIETLQWSYIANMDQGLSSTDAPTFATLNTGQGDYELYSMDQDVTTSDTVTFSGINLGGVNPTITSILDEDDMISDSDTSLATQQSIKTYTDNQVSSKDEIAELEDVGLETLLDGDLLIYNATESFWMNKAMNGEATIDSGGTLTLSDNVVDDAELVNALTYSGTLNLSGNWEISGTQVSSSAAELNYLDGATAASGGLIFGNGTNFTQNTEQLFWSETEGRLGIGTNTPSYKLDVDGDIQISSGSELYSQGSATLGNRTYTTPQYISSGETFTTSLQSLDDQVYNLTAGLDGLWRDAGTYIYAANYSDFVIEDTGYVGIGTSTPSEKLEISGNLLLSGTISNNVVNLNGSNFTSTEGMDHDLGDNAGTYSFDIRDSDDANLFSLDSKGNLNLSGESANYSLNNGSSTAFSITNSGTGDSFIVNDVSGDTTPFVIDTDGSVGVRTASPSYNLEVAGTLGVSDSINFSGLTSEDALNTSILALDSANNVELLDISSSLLPDGTEGQMMYNNAGTWTAFDGVFWDDTNNNLGIGTTTPSDFKLQIAGSIGPDADDTYDLGSNTARWQDLYLGPSTLHIGTSTSDEGTLSYNTTNNDLEFATTGGDFYFDTTNGKVGIGTNTPTYDLEIEGTLGTTQGLILGTDSITTENAIDISLDGLTTGKAINIETSSNMLSTGDLFSIKHTDATYTARGLSGKMFNLERSLTSNSTEGITFDNSTSVHATDTTSVTFSHESGAGSNRILIVTIGSSDGSFSQNYVSSITYNGESLTKLVSQAGRYGTTVSELWYLMDPPIGNYDVVVTYPGGDPTSNVSAGATTWFGVDSETPFGDYVLGDSGAICDSSINIPSAPGDIVIDIISGGGSSKIAGSNQTEHWVEATGGHSSKPGASTVTMSWSNLPVGYCFMLGVPLKPSVANGLEISGTLANLTSTCTSPTEGECEDTSNILHLGQNYNYATGDVMTLTNAGIGKAMNLDTTNASGNGLRIDIESNSVDNYALWATGNNGANTGLYVGGNGNVGIGKVDPGYNLEIAGSFGTSGEINFSGLTTGDASNSSILALDAANNVELLDISSSLLPSGAEGQMLYNNAGTWTAFDNLFWDDSSNYLGIGTTTPSYNLDINGNLGVTGGINLSGLSVDDANSAAMLALDAANNVELLDISSSLLPSGAEGQMLYNNAGTWTAFDEIYWDDSSNYLGMGTTNPMGTFHIDNAGFTIDQQQTTWETMANSTTDQWQSFTAGVTDTLEKIELYTVNAYSGTIYIRSGEGTSGGAISTTTVTTGTGWQEIDVENASLTAGNTYTIHLSDTSSLAGSLSDDYAGGRSSKSATEDFAFKTYRASGNHLVFNSEGNLGIGDTDPGSLLSISGLGSSTGTTLVIDANGDVWKDSSSLRYKENIENLGLNTSKLLELEPIEFDYKETGAHSFGYIAEDLDKLGLTDLVIYDKEGLPSSIRYDKFSVYLVEVYKEQTELLNHLQKSEGNIKKILAEQVDKVKDLERTMEELNSTSESTEGSLIYEEPKEILAQIESTYQEFKDFVTELGLSIDKETQALVAENNFSVLGDTTLSDTIITGDLSVGVMQIDSLNNSINILGSPCYMETTDTYKEELCETQELNIQNNLAGRVNFFGGKILLNPNGTLVIEGEIKARKYAVETSVEGASAGKAVIPAEENITTITTTALTENSLIMVTPEEPVAIASKQIDEDKFEIKIGETLKEDLIISWWIIN